MPFLYPPSYEISRIMPQLEAQGRAGRIWLDFLPQKNVNAGTVRWEQKDNMFGLQAMRGLDGAPTRVQRQGSKVFNYEPGIFGEFQTITETELTIRAGAVSDLANTPIPVGDLVMEAQMLLVEREFDRMEWSVSRLLTTGTLAIRLDGPDGLQAAVYNDTYSVQTYTATIPWATFATATPILNFQAVQQLGVGYSTDLGAGAVAVMNSVTANRMLNNANAADFGGRRNQYGATYNDLTNYNQFLIAQNLPRIQVDDRGYYPILGQTGGVSGGFIKFIADGVVAVIGKRPGGAPIGNYQMTRNMNNPNGTPGPYQYVIDRANGINAEKRTPPNIEIHRGHNGGPCLYFPSSVVIMSV